MTWDGEKRQIAFNAAMAALQIAYHATMAALCMLAAILVKPKKSKGGAKGKGRCGGGKAGHGCQARCGGEGKRGI